jgi:hypothetical protein
MKQMRSAPLWEITQRAVVIPYRLSGQPIGPTLKGQEIQVEKFLPAFGFLGPL